MIKIVKLQHFGTNPKASAFELTGSTFTNVPQLNQSHVNNFNQQQQQQQQNDKLLKQSSDYYRIPSTKQSSNEPVNKIFTNSNDTDDEVVKSKKVSNLNRSKSATEMSTLKNNSNNNNSFNDIIKINNLNVQQNPIADVAQAVSKRSILKKQSLKQRKIIEWAKQKTSILREDQEQNHSLMDESIKNAPSSSAGAGDGFNSSRSNKKADDDDFTNFVGDAAAAIIQKSDIERNLRAKLFETELIDLSKARFKSLEMMDYQKKLFIERQLKKAKSLPGLLRCTALQSAQNHKQSNHGDLHSQNSNRYRLDDNHQFSTDSISISSNNKINSNNHQTTDNSNPNLTIEPFHLNSEEINHISSGPSIKFNNSQIDANKESNLLEERKVKKDKFREMLSNTELNETTALPYSTNLVLRKSSQFSSVNGTNSAKGNGIKKSKTLHVANNSYFSDKNSNNVMLSLNNYGIKHFEQTAPSEVSSSNFYPKSSHSRNSTYFSTNDENQYKSNDGDSLTIRGFRTTKNKTPHVSFFLHQNSREGSLVSNKNTPSETKLQNSSNNFLSSQNLSRNSNTKRVVSLHLQFANGSNNANMPTITPVATEKSTSSTIKSKSLSFRENLLQSQTKYTNSNFNKGLLVSTMNQNKPPTATSVHSNQVPLDSTSKFLFEMHDQSVQNTEYAFTPINSAKYPISDNRFQDLLRIVKPPYLLNEIKDVNKIIEKNDALKSAHLDMDTKDKINQIKEKGYKLAVRAKKAIASGDYQV